LRESRFSCWKLFLSDRLQHEGCLICDVCPLLLSLLYLIYFRTLFCIIIVLCLFQRGVKIACSLLNITRSVYMKFPLSKLWITYRVFHLKRNPNYYSWTPSRTKQRNQ
jgi:hypothetical protein